MFTFEVECEESLIKVWKVRKVLKNKRFESEVFEVSIKGLSRNS